MANPLQPGFDIDEELMSLRDSMRDDDTLRQLPEEPTGDDYAKFYASALLRVLHRDGSLLRINEALRDELRATRREVAALRTELHSERLLAQTERRQNEKRHQEMMALLKNLPGYQ